VKPLLGASALGIAEVEDVFFGAVCFDSFKKPSGFPGGFWFESRDVPRDV
jgi:hypothetical protein